MSCTENESGPFVVFFLPAVVGCLTILLARRWANSQVSNTSSTAVSRRRKIIKDPLIKRPLPLACKMMPPGSKKASGVNKKVTSKTQSACMINKCSCINYICLILTQEICMLEMLSGVFILIDYSVGL